MDYEGLKLAGHRFIRPELHEQWDSYVESYQNDEFQLRMITSAVAIMDSLNFDSSTKSMMDIARNFNKRFEGMAYITIRGILFNYSKFGPNFCLALEYAKALSEKEEGLGDGSVTLESTQVQLLLDKSLENLALDSRTLKGKEEGEFKM